MIEPKLTEADHDRVRRAAYDPDSDALPNLVARMVAAAEQTARAEAFRESSMIVRRHARAATVADWLEERAKEAREAKP